MGYSIIFVAKLNNQYNENINTEKRRLKGVGERIISSPEIRGTSPRKENWGLSRKVSSASFKSVSKNGLKNAFPVKLLY